MITKITVNHLIEPLGYDFTQLHIAFQVEQLTTTANYQKELIIQTADQEVYRSERTALGDFTFQPQLTLAPRTRYQVVIRVYQDNECFSATSWFETGKQKEPFTAQWLGGERAVANNLFSRTFTLQGPVKNARLYVSALGVYEAYLNEAKIGDELLAPGFTAYNQWTQIQTYDVTAALATQAEQTLLISVGDGWYKGNMGFEGGQENIYGDQQAVIAELHLTYQDGTTAILTTDENWQLAAGSITQASIYYGEDYDALKEPQALGQAPVIQPDIQLTDRLSLPMRVMAERPAVAVITSPAGETILDFGQNLAGWVRFYNRVPKGQRVKLEFGEILQDGNFYRENLREARAAFCYVSDGKAGWVRPHFTYYGFRYARVTGVDLPLTGADFVAEVIYSEMATTGALTTNNDKVNRLFENVLWGQKSNFLDVPTDCPQRDERLGWTGDAQIFSKTALYNMNAYPFFRKFMRDMCVEQQRLGGKLPMYAPALEATLGGAAVWSDAITIIPWNSYQMTGDLALIREYYPAMKQWVDWVQTREQAEDNQHLWLNDFQFGDWLALDGEDPSLPTGRTEEGFIASIYYYHSTQILAESAQLLGKTEDANYYTTLAEQIKIAIQAEYFTATGRLALTTQTAYALVLFFELVPTKQLPRVVADFKKQLKKDDYHLKTGFVGTPIVCTTLSTYGEHELAVQIFLNEAYPSWLYAVNLGATTIWERWNSVLADGSMNPEGMNSLNHYAYGSIMEWGYQSLLGLVATSPGFQTVTIRPGITPRFHQVSGHYDTSFGRLALSWQVDQAQVTIKLTVPYGITAALDLPRLGQKLVLNDQEVLAEEITLTGGQYEISYLATSAFVNYYSLDMPIKELVKAPELWATLQDLDQTIAFFETPDHLENFGAKTIPEACQLLPFIQISDEQLSQMRACAAQWPITY